MQAKRKAIKKLLDEKSEPVFRSRIREGLVEHMTDDLNLRGHDFDPGGGRIYGLTNRSGRGWDRTILPAWQYPELYDLKNEITRLEKLIGQEAELISEMQDHVVAFPR